MAAKPTYPHKYRTYIGSRLMRQDSSWLSAIRALVDFSQYVVETGHARVIRDDGVVIAGVDLDLGVTMRREK